MTTTVTIAPQPRRNSIFGIISLILSLLALPPAAGLLCGIAGAALIAHHPNGDSGTPWLILLTTAFTALLAIAYAFFSLLSLALAILGLSRTGRECKWSKISLIVFFSTLILGGAAATLIWMFVK